MSTGATPMSESSLQSQGFAPVLWSTLRPFYWSVRRELWENRWIYLGPAAVAAVFLLGFLISTIHLPATMRGMSVDLHHRDAIAAPYDILAGLMMLTTILVNVFYCADAL